MKRIIENIATGYYIGNERFEAQMRADIDAAIRAEKGAGK